MNNADHYRFSLPPLWHDGAWWTAPNAVHDVGEVHARWRREASRLRHRAARRLPDEALCHSWVGYVDPDGRSGWVCWRCGHEEQMPERMSS